MRSTFILVNRQHGVAVYPFIGRAGRADVTTDQTKTPVYLDGEDNPEIKARLWSAVLKRQFSVEAL